MRFFAPKFQRFPTRLRYYSTSTCRRCRRSRAAARREGTARVIDDNGIVIAFWVLAATTVGCALMVASCAS